MSLPLYMIVNRTLPLWEWNPNLCITKDNAVLIMPAKFLYEGQITLYGPRGEYVLLLDTSTRWTMVEWPLDTEKRLHILGVSCT